MLLSFVHVQLVEAVSFLVHAVPLVECVLGGVGPGLHGAVGVHQNGLQRQGLDRVRVARIGLSMSAKVLVFLFSLTEHLNLLSELLQTPSSQADGVPTQQQLAASILPLPVTLASLLL